MSNSDKEVENQILEAGKKLIDPPSSVDELLSLLDNLFFCLMDVEQSPPVSMQKALSPLMKALVSGKILKHSDIDVKVAVAACISEITRITAPESPYDDDEMKEVFKLLVSSFEDLADKSSCSYSKRLSILEAAAKVRSCIVMLDLECYSLIIEMFQHFLKAIREHHPGDVFSYMENIMTLVLEESEDIPPEMLSPILHYVKKDAEVSQLSRRLAEQVLGNCAIKLKTYLNEAVESSGVPLDMYSNIVASICEGTFSALQQDQIVLHEKEDSQDHLTRDTEVEDKQKAAEISTPERTDAPKDEPGKSGVSNGVSQQNDSSDSTKKQDITSGEDEPQQLDNPSNTDVDNTSELKLDVEHQMDSSTNSDIKEETKPVAVLESKDVLTSPPDDSSGNAATSSENEKKTSVQALPSKTSADENPNADTKRKGSVDKRKASELENHDENLVGSRVRVWWPLDQAYFKGVITLYVSEKKKHLVCYDDGDQELLNLKSERWYFEDEPESNKEEENEENLKPVGKSESNKKKAGKPKDQGVSITSKASSKKKEEPSKTRTASKSKSGKSGVSNGVSQQNDSSDSTKKQDITSGKDEPQQLDNPSNTDVDNTSELKLGVEHQPKEKEKQSSSVEEADLSTNSDIKEETEPVAVPESKDVLTSPPDDSSGNAATSSENEKKTSVQASPSKTSADETANVSSPSRGEDVPEQSRHKKTVNQKKKESSTKEFKPSATSATEEASEEPNTSEAEVTRKSGKKVASSVKAKPTVPPSKKSTSETKVAKQSEKKAMGSDNVQEPTKIKEEKKKPGRGKAMYEESLHFSSGDNEKDAVSSEKSAIKSKREAKQPVEENPNSDTKRKRSGDKRKASDIENHDESLLGSRIRVWWPMDQAYYKGVISMYVSEKKKHVVCYDDGDQELLNLKRERWYFEDEPESSQLKTESSAKKVGGASSSKSKATFAPKSGKKSQADRIETKSKVSKETNKEEENSSEESDEEEENPKPVGKSESSKKKSGKPKDQGVSGTSKASSKKKEEPSKTTTASKSKSGPAKSAQLKSKTGKGKAKTGSASTPASKDKDSDVESESEETPKASETETKGKPIKSQGSQAKSSKKRKR